MAQDPLNTLLLRKLQTSSHVFAVAVKVACHF